MPERTKTWFVPGANHNIRRDRDAEMMAAVKAFLNRAC